MQVLKNCLNELSKKCDMRNFLFLIGGVLLSINLFAQENIQTYQTDYYNQDFPASGSHLDQNGDIVYKFFAFSKEEDALISIVVQEKNLEKFKSILMKARDFYIEWNKPFLENRMGEIGKDQKFEMLQLYSNFGLENGAYKNISIELKAQIESIDGKDVLIVENESELKADHNNNLTHKGFYLAFDRPSEVDFFLSTIEVAQKFHLDGSQEQKKG